MTEELQNSTARRPNRRRRPAEHDRFIHTRQWLNGIFMLGAIAGVIVMLMSEDRTVGIIIVLVSMLFKFVEALLRIIR